MQELAFFIFWSPVYLRTQTLFDCLLEGNVEGILEMLIEGMVVGWVRGDHNGKKQVCFKMLFRQNKVFYDHISFFNGKLGHRGPTQTA